MLGLSVEAVATMIGCLPTQALAFLAVFGYATHATQAIAFELETGLNAFTRYKNLKTNIIHRQW